MRFRKYKTAIITFGIVFLGLDFIYILVYGQRQPQDKCRSAVLRIGPGYSNSTIPVRKIRDVCDSVPQGKYSDWTTNIKGQSRYFIAAPRKLSYCTLHGEMDDIWARIFEVLQNTEKTEVDMTHKKLPQISAVLFENAVRRKTETVLYVRDPYTSLYLAYHDRFHLAYTAQDDKCENLSFQEFLDKMISHVKLRQHWGLSVFAPLVPKCRLCDIKIFAIVREEHFILDMQNMLSNVDCKVNVTKNRVKHTIMNFLNRRDLLMYAIVLAKLKFMNPSCVYNQTGQMLWKSLQFMGYIKSSVPYPKSLYKVDVSFHPDMLVKSALKDSEPLNKAEKWTQRQTFLADAYSGIKEETIEYIQEIYKYDFKIFGYSNKRPS